MIHPEGIVSWITENNYSKSSEFIYYILSLTIPALICFFLGFYSKKDKTNNQIFEHAANKNILSYYIIPTFLYFLLLRLNIDGQIDLYHEGEKLQLNGLPYKDFYLQHGLILNYGLPKLGTIFFSNSIEGVRRIFSLFEPLAYIILYFLGLHIYRAGALLAILPPLFCNGKAYWIGLREGIAISVILALVSTENFFLTGFLSGLTYWFSIEYGIYSIAACTSYLAIAYFYKQIKFNNIIKYFSGLSASILPVLILFCYLGIIKDFLSNTFAQLFYQSIVWGFPFSKFNSDIWSEGFRIYASILIIIISLAYVAYKLGKEEFNEIRKLLAVTLLAIFFFRTALGRADYGHWIDGSTLSYILILLPFDYFIFKKKNLKINIYSSLLFLPLLYYLNHIHKPLEDISQILDNYWPSQTNNIELEKIGRIKIPEQQKNRLIQIKNFVDKNSNKNEYIYDFSNQGAYYFILDRKSPTKYFNPIYAATNEMQNSVINDLSKTSPKIVIFNTGSVFDKIDGIPNIKRNKLIFEYISNNYTEAAEIDGAKILIKK